MAADGAEGLEWLSDYLVCTLKSPTWVIPVAEFVDNGCAIFDDAEENKLEYTICHNDFKRLIDDLFTAHLLEVSVTPEQFQNFCQHGLQSSAPLHHILIEQLLSVEDFLIFKAMMVKRNADLDRRAALEELSRREGGSEMEMACPGAVVTPEAVGLSHSSGAVSFAIWPMTDGVLAWHDRDFVYHGIPEELNGAMLFAGPHKTMPPGTLTFTSTQAVTLYLFHENSGGKRHGGFGGPAPASSCSWLKALPEWLRLGGTKMKWGPVKGKDMWIAVWARNVAAGATINLQMQEPFVGGFAVKADTGEWRLYEEQEQLMKALTASGMEVGAEDEELCHAASLAEEAEQRLEQAQIEQAIALSLQAEEERLRQVETSAAPEMGMPPPFEAAPLESTAPPLAAPLAAPMDAPVAATHLAQPSAEAVEASRYEEPIPDMAPLFTAPKELNPVMPRMMRLRPLQGAGQMAPPNPGPAYDQMCANAVPTATASVAAPLAPPPPPSYQPPLTQQPTEEERRLRSEHLKQQRALLMEKRKVEREQQLQAYHAARGTNPASVDRYSAAAGVAGGAGMGLAASLAPGAEPISQADSAEAAKYMRQALTLQLRQSLTSELGAS